MLEPTNYDLNVRYSCEYTHCVGYCVNTELRGHLNRDTTTYAALFLSENSLWLATYIGVGITDDK